MNDIEQKKIFAKNLNKQLSLTNKTQKEVADAIGVSPQTFNTWCQAIALPRMGKVQLLADYFNIRKTDLIDDTNIPDYPNIHPISTQRLPMLGEVACGKPIFMNEEREFYVESGTKIQADFCLTARGDSMINLRIEDGDIVFVRKQDMVENGEIAIVAIDDEVTLKRFFYYREKSLVILKAANPAYEDFIYQNEEIDSIHILGKAVAFQSDVRYQQI